ncbi:MAG TPA: alpha/beta fold hydrolase [Actinomycetes bacterium]|nr:alpha/beta fold hydrolase [Actinomycetes bacterium]
MTRAEERIWVRSDRAVARACAERAGPILDHMSTANVARDLDLLRRAVGDAKLTYAGYSYGSYLGSTYANLFPGKVRALVVDGVLDPVAWSTGRGDQARRLPFSTRLGSAKGAYETLQEFLRL